jgi:NitT/TauT family transport system ATP-binding protein
VTAQILDDLSFEVKRGEFISLVGPSGCGKTTLMTCLAGLQRADSGTLTFRSIPISAPPVGTAVVFQDYSRSLLPWQRNLGNVIVGMRRRSDLSRRDKQLLAVDLLASVGLAGFEDYYPWQISGGMQQRVAIARALASQPELLLLDEPLAAVDAQTRWELQDLLLQIADRFSQTCVLVTHDVEEAIYLASRVLVLSRRPARIIADISVDLPRKRDQLTTREHPAFLALRHQILDQIRGGGGPAAAAAA